MEPQATAAELRAALQAAHARIAELERILAPENRVVLDYPTGQSVRLQEHDRLSVVLDTLPDMIWLKDAAGIYLGANRAFEEGLGLSPEQYLGKTDFDLVGQQQAELYRSADRHVIASQAPVTIEEQLVAGDGRIIYLETTKKPLYDAERNFIGVLGVSRDITHRKRMEDHLRESEEKYRTLLESLEASVATIDADGVFHYINRIGAQSLGETQGAVIGKTMHDLFPQPVADEQLSYIREVIAGGRGQLRENRTIIQGKPRWYRTSIQPLRDASGAVVLAFINTFDITERKEAEILLEERVLARTAEMQDLYDNAPTGYHSLDSNGVFVMMNQTELNWLGYTREEVVGRMKFYDILTPASRETFDENFPRFKASGYIQDLEFEFVRRDGRTFPVSITASVIYDADGVYQMSRSTVVDITERKQNEQTLRASEERLRRMNFELERAMQARSDFLANMSHELRTPLNGILTLSEALLEQIRGPLNERQQRSVRLIEASGQHLLELINDILDLSKIEAGKIVLNPVDTLIDEICQAGLMFIRELALKKELHLEYVNPYPHVQLHADPKRLKQILVNLLSNAVKFTSPGGRVSLHVALDPETQTLRLRVTDTGIGIPAAEMGKLFQPFTQIDSSLARQHEGSGLGLALVNHLTQLHGGSVSVESAGIPGQGSCFTVTLPYKPVSAEEPVSSLPNNKGGV